MRSLFFRRRRGGDAVKVIVQEGLFDPYHATREYEEQALPKGKHGAVVTFVGTMRDFNDGHNVSSMFLEHYPGMTERHIEAVCQEATAKWDVSGARGGGRRGGGAGGGPGGGGAGGAARRARGGGAGRGGGEEREE